jgi:hypothetical protein
MSHATGCVEKEHSERGCLSLVQGGSCRCGVFVLCSIRVTVWSRLFANQTAPLAMAMPPGSAPTRMVSTTSLGRGRSRPTCRPGRW